VRDDEKTKDTKEVYEKPRLRSIELAAEEVLAVGCKTTNQSAVGKPTCNSRPCSQRGS
jgi:hypothetical protein